MSNVNGKPLVYDVYCGAGGCTKGYQDAGFYVIGIDNKQQPHYCGDEFRQMDALEFLRQLVAGLWPRPFFVHTSPPCQAYTRMGNVWQGKEYPDLVGATRQALEDSGLPYVIENVVGAPLVNPVMLCGSMFGLKVYRHRLFETKPLIVFRPYHFSHADSTPKAGRGEPSPKGFISVAGHFSNVPYVQEAMGIGWMVRDELAQSVPPVFARWIGERMIEMIAERSG